MGALWRTYFGHAGCEKSPQFFFLVSSFLRPANFECGRMQKTDKNGIWDSLRYGKRPQNSKKQHLQRRRGGSTLCALFGKTPEVCGIFATSWKRLIYGS
jgi:hypothetical protein